MQTEYLIAIDEFCAIHDIEISFISSLQQTGLIEITKKNDTEFIDINQLQQLEKLVRLYFDLDINLEGIETITHLLQRISSLQDEVISLRNRLQFYESNE
jgi:molybdopterin-guanine dinucleotide biosynthesis protein A